MRFGAAAAGARIMIGTGRLDGDRHLQRGREVSDPT